MRRWPLAATLMASARRAGVALGWAGAARAPSNRCPCSPLLGFPGSPKIDVLKEVGALVLTSLLEDRLAGLATFGSSERQEITARGGGGGGLEGGVLEGRGRKGLSKGRAGVRGRGVGGGEVRNVGGGGGRGLSIFLGVVLEGPDIR